MMYYFDIHVAYGNGDGDGYSIPVAMEDSNDEAEVVQKAVDECLFEYEEDVFCIDYVAEITEEEYTAMVNC